MVLECVVVFVLVRGSSVDGAGWCVFCRGVIVWWKVSVVVGCAERVGLLCT